MRRAKPKPKPEAPQPRPAVGKMVYFAISDKAASLLLDIFDSVELTGEKDRIVNEIYEDVADQLTK